GCNMTEAIDGSSVTKPRQLGIILVGQQFETPALKFFIVAMNRQQSQFEYQFLPNTAEDDLLAQLAKTTLLNRQETRALAHGFPERFKARLSEMYSDYQIVDRNLPDYFIVVTMARFEDGYFSLREPGTSIIGLGNWRKTMAPPSIYEFVQTLIVR